MNATDTYPAGYPSSKHIADERYTGKQMNGLMVPPFSSLPARRFCACADTALEHWSDRPVDV